VAGSLPPMTGSRVLPLLVGLWACSAFGQAVSVNASQSIPLADGGIAFARAYWVAGNSAQYAMAGAGAVIQVFDATGTEVPSLEPSPNGPFASFAVANGVQIGAATFTTVVAAADRSSPGCSTAMCLRIFFWDSTNGFQLKNTAPTTVASATAMAIDAPGSAINIYYATTGPQMLYEQAINVSATNGVVTVGGLNSRSLPSAISVVQGVTVDGVDSPSALYLSDNASNLYTFPTDVTNTDGGIFAQPSGAGFGFIAGVFFAPDLSAPSVLLAGGVSDGLYVLNPYNSAPSSIVVQQYLVRGTDGGVTFPSAASGNSTTPFLLVTEDQNQLTGLGPWLHFLSLDGGGPIGPDGGSSDGGATDGGGADAGGVPTIPIIAPGPGALPGTTNSCNCSTAGSAPVLLALLLPLLLPRRRR
jgi:hypothetical protein